MQLISSHQSITTGVVEATATTTEREPVCDELGCEQDATAFDGERVMFVCDEHQATAEVQA